MRHTSPVLQYSANAGNDPTACAEEATAGGASVDDAASAWTSGAATAGGAPIGVLRPEPSGIAFTPLGRNRRPILRMNFEACRRGRHKATLTKEPKLSGEIMLTCSLRTPFFVRIHKGMDTAESNAMKIKSHDSTPQTEASWQKNPKQLNVNPPPTRSCSTLNTFSTTRAGELAPRETDIGIREPASAHRPPRRRGAGM